MKIGFVTPEYPIAAATPSAGIGSSVRNISLALVEQGFSVTVFVHSQISNDVIIDEGVVVHLIQKKTYPFLSWFRYRKHLQSYINFQIAKNGIQIIEAPDYTGVTAFMKLAAPLVIRFHGSDAYFCNLEKRRQKLKNYLFEQIAVRSADAYSAPTRFAAQLTSKIFRIAAAKVELIPNGISLKQFENGHPQQFDAGMILYVGTLIRKKGVLELPGILSEVLQHCPSARLIIAGADSYDLQSQSESTWKLLQQMAAPSLIKQIEYVGKIPYSEVAALIKRANVCVFPTFAETQGMVTIEAMALHKAVVTSDFGWNRELIDDGVNGHLADPKEHKAFAGKIVRLLNDADHREKIAGNATLKAKNKFDIKVVATQTVAFYNSVLNR